MFIFKYLKKYVRKALLFGNKMSTQIRLKP